MTPTPPTHQSMDDALAEAERKAWDSLSRYKFVMFGYWCGVWVHLNRVSGQQRSNPWRPLIKLAQEHVRNESDGNGSDNGSAL